MKLSVKWTQDENAWWRQTIAWRFDVWLCVLKIYFVLINYTVRLLLWSWLIIIIIRILLLLFFYILLLLILLKKTGSFGDTLWSACKDHVIMLACVYIAHCSQESRSVSKMKICVWNSLEYKTEFERWLSGFKKKGLVSEGVIEGDWKDAMMVAPETLTAHKIICVIKENLRAGSKKWKIMTKDLFLEELHEYLSNEAFQHFSFIETWRLVISL